MPSLLYLLIIVGLCINEIGVKMLKLAIIGTNWITDQFIEAALQSKRYHLTAVYSRCRENAAQFAEKYDSPALFDDFDAFASSSLIDVVYVASPNSFHAPQAIQLMEAGKHVIVEKPMAANFLQAQKMVETAQKHNVLMIEAYMSAHLPNFKILKESMPSIGPIRQGFITYCQYSSRYPKYLAGERPNTFEPTFANGSMVDIGFYCLSAAVELFGEPESLKAEAQLLESGVDGNGSVVLQYRNFNIVLQHSKTSNSYLQSEIQGEDGALLIDMISTAKKVTKFNRGSEVGIDLSVQQESNPMYYEALEFADQIEKGQSDDSATQRSLVVARLLEEIRRQTGVVYPSDAN